VAGRIQTRSYEQDGQRRYTTEVVADEVRFLEWGDKGQTQRSTGLQTMRVIRPQGTANNFDKGASK